MITLAGVGMAIGGLGSDASIETADVVIQTNQLVKIATAIQTSKKTNQIAEQNIGLAFSVKGLVLILGAGGYGHDVRSRFRGCRSGFPGNP